MARVVPLDPANYSGTYKAIGGSMSLDFANLVSFRGTNHAHDWLDPPANLVVWETEVAEQSSAGRWAPTAKLLDRALAMREQLNRIFTALAHGTTTAADDLAALTAAAHAGLSHQHLTAGHGRLAWTFPDGHPAGCRLLDTVALDATHILTATDPDRLRTCPGCGWVFLDTSPAGRRRWCDPADCGNRARQRRHYHRSKSAP